ncbi:HGGxSTG domain-containing protein [Xanthomonas hortorum]|uniref:Uncharacterized protein n=1 Tax=Xanthomonas hortorum pv. hederae TaxID=453603 RepID=A0A9X4BQ12_9XANT|nr:HGGxSTG domain-containing protein [Xanthomonas hortorum]MDC8637051.1 hypothetical protein [Xanthomonas hortorum pv. hederae]
MDDGYLSRDQAHLAALQRKRRARLVRIDYMPSITALAAIDAKRVTLRPGSVDATNSATINAIVTEWADLTGIKCCDVERPMSPAEQSESCDQYAGARKTSEAERSACAQEFGELPGINARIAGARAGAYESGVAAKLAELKSRQAARAATMRIPCGAKRHRDGQPCQAKSEPGKRRCRFHGGCSTGPKTDAGRRRALANLRQNSGDDAPA